MEALVHQGYSTKKLQILNRGCRLYLQVMTLSDIMNGNGDGFTESYKCRKDHQMQNSFKWPKQPEPSTTMKKCWKAALRKTFGLRAGVTSHKLGIWVHSNLNHLVPPFSASSFEDIFFAYFQTFLIFLILFFWQSIYQRQDKSQLYSMVPLK